VRYGIDYYNVPDRRSPEVWAVAREQEGWSCLGIGDHVVLDQRWALHAPACLGAMAASTQHVQLATMFANNVVRSPVEFAQLALTLQSLSPKTAGSKPGSGRAGHPKTPSPSAVTVTDTPALARRYREAIRVVSQLFAGDTSSTASSTTSNLTVGDRYPTHPRSTARSVDPGVYATSPHSSIDWRSSPARSRWRGWPTRLRPDSCRLVATTYVA